MSIRDYDRLFIGGDWVAPEGTDMISVISPMTEEVVGRVPDGTEAELHAAMYLQVRDGHITRIEEYLDSARRSSLKAAREALAGS